MNEIHIANERVYQAIKLMCKRNDVIQDTHGNVSMKIVDPLSGKEIILIKPSGIPYDEINIGDICHVELDENGLSSKVIGKFKPSVDLIHHAMIYKMNPSITAICHTHSPHVVAHAIACAPIRCLCTEHADYFGDEVNCLPYRDLGMWGVIHVQKGEKALLLANHGALTFAKDPVVAVNLAIQLENVARKNILAQSVLTRNIPSLPKEEVEKWHWRYNNHYGQ